MICTEWMARTLGSHFETHLPIFRRKKVGCIHWGSKTGAPEPKLWFVDLYRKDHSPYDPREIEAIKQHIALSKTKKQ